MLDERKTMKCGNPNYEYETVFDMIKCCLRYILDKNETLNYNEFQLKGASLKRDEGRHYFNRNQNSWVKNDYKDEIKVYKQAIKDAEKKIKDHLNSIKGYHLLVYKTSLDLIKNWVNFTTNSKSKANALQIKSSYDNICNDVTIKLNDDVFGIIGEFVGLDSLKKYANHLKIQKFGKKIWNELFNQSHLLNKLTKKKLYGLMVKLGWIIPSSYGNGYDAYSIFNNWTYSVNKNLNKTTLIKCLVSNVATETKDRDFNPVINSFCSFTEKNIVGIEERLKNSYNGFDKFNTGTLLPGFDKLNTGNRLKIIDYLTKM
jgi:hypothetical protein